MVEQSSESTQEEEASDFSCHSDYASDTERKRKRKQPKTSSSAQEVARCSSSFLQCHSWLLSDNRVQETGKLSREEDQCKIRIALLTRLGSFL